MHQVHEASLPLLAFGWTALIAAHGWNRLRHRGGGLPWVVNVLWLSTWVMVASTVIIGLEEGLLGHEEEVAGTNWPHLAQQGLTGVFLALLAANVALAVGWWRRDPVGTLARAARVGGRQTRRALASLGLMTVGMALVASIGLAVVSAS